MNPKPVGPGRDSGRRRVEMSVIFKRTTRAMMTGWVRNAKGEKRYFQPTSGIMCKGLKKVQSKWYYFDPDRGVACAGWITDQDGNRRYFDPKTFVMASGEQIIDGKSYTFDEKEWEL
ncbi:MAG: N-acetylmuramoyl-L-alanine amidase family protein [Blautia sp.]